jgi:hypothetical protein
MFLNSMLKWKFGQAGLKKPGKPSRAGNRMIDSNKTATSIHIKQTPPIQVNILTTIAHLCQIFIIKSIHTAQ